VKIAVISDIHANLQALEAVLRQIEKRGVDMIACLGDLVGYGSQPNEVVELIRKNADFVVMGNHDASVVGKLDYSYHYEAAKNALDWTKKVITEDNYNWLNQLPHTRRYKDIGFSHGSPIVPEQFDYVYTIDHAFSLVDEYDTLPHINFIGHSHLIKGYSFSKIMVDEISLPRKGFRVQSKYLFSVGSVGQPRDGNPLSAFFIYDIDNEEVLIERVLYDITDAADKIIKAGLSPNFAKRLSLGI
jgi:predicted phosphodiesterase